jgi:hypothetical protein
MAPLGLRETALQSAAANTAALVRARKPLPLGMELPEGRPRTEEGREKGEVSASLGQTEGGSLLQPVGKRTYPHLLRWRWRRVQ